VDERDRLDRAAGWNAGKPGGRDLAHLPVDRREDVAHGVRVAAGRTIQEFGDPAQVVGHGRSVTQKNCPTRGGLRLQVLVPHQRGQLPSTLCPINGGAIPYRSSQPRHARTLPVASAMQVSAPP